MIDYKIISTGSKGNAVVINGTILIDCGVSFRALKDAYKGLQLVLLTHIHGDHFNRTTIRKLAQERPTLRWGCPEWLIGDLRELVEPKQIDLYEMDEYFSYGAQFAIRPFALVHNVPNCGYKIHVGAGESMLFYATDTNTLDHIEAKNYDLYLVEANYTEAEITERIRRKQESGEHCYEWAALENHLSREKCDDWLYRNMGANSRYVYLHEHEEAHA